MAQVRHLAKAPITEALVDFRVKARSDLDVHQFAVLRDQLRGQLPVVSEQRGIEASFTFHKEKGPEPSVQDLGPRGYFFKSQDGLNIAQFRVDGFTYNRLKPYTSWDEIFPVALNLWRLYTSTAAPTHITRLALRYINQVEVSSAVERFRDIMTVPPPIPPGLPQYISRFLTRVTLHDPSTELAAHVSHAFEPDPGGNARGTLILDIDAFCQRDLAVEDANALEQITEIFGQLHALKNKVFFESFTDQTIATLQ